MIRLFFLLFLLFFSINVYSNYNNKSLQDYTYSSHENLEEHIRKMAKHCWDLREKNIDSAIRIGKEAFDLALKYKVEKEIPRICNFLGVLYLHYVPDNKTAIPYFHQALETSYKLNDSVQMAYAYNNLGDAFLFTGNRVLALQYAKSSVQIFEKLNHTSGIAYGYTNLGLVYRAEGNYSLALDCFNRVKEMRENVGDKNGVASVLREIALVYQENGQLDQAEAFFEESYQYHLKINNIRYAAYCLSGMADNYYLQKRFQKAYKYYLQAVKLNNERDFSYGQIDNYIGLALVYAQQNKRKQGENILNKALQISASIYNPSKTLKIYKSYGTFYQILKDYKNSTHSLEHFLELSDSILSIQQFDILNEIQSNFVLNQSLKETQQQLKSQKTEEKYLFVISLLMLILIVVFIWRMHAQRKMNQKLKQINESKDKLFSVISHDLKAPFHSLLGFTEILSRNLKNKDYENANKYADIVNRSAGENLKLLNNLLNWSLSQTGRINLNPKSISLEYLFKELKNLFDENANNYGIQLVFSSSIKGKVLLDPDILKIIIGNLISNALKYTEKKGLIQISAWSTSSRIMLSVTDNGLGMTQDMLVKLFDNFQSTTSPGLRNEKGSGLGLILCSELIKIHNGSISVKSELNKGSVFEIEIPRA